MIVVDSSAIVDALITSPRSDWVLGEFEHQSLVAPAHQAAEVLSAIARIERAGDITATQGARCLDAYARLDQEIVTISRHHLDRAWELRDRVRVLDGLYVAVAEERRTALVTTDQRLSRAGLVVDIRSPTA